MLGIKLNTDFLRLEPKTRASLEFNNPLFDGDSMQGDYVMPVNVPYAGNARFFGFNHEMHLRNRTRTYENVELFLKKAILSKGILDVNSVDDNYINTSMRINLGSLPCMAKKLNEFDLGGLRVLGKDMSTIITNANTILGQNYPDTEFNFPMIYNPEFYGDKNGDYAEFMNHYNYAFASLIDNTGGNTNCLVPMIYLHYLLKQGFAADGYTLDSGSDFLGSDAAGKQMVVYNNRALDKRAEYSGTTGFEAGPFLAIWYSQAGGETGIAFNDDSTPDHFDNGGCYNTSTGVFTVQEAGVHAFKLYLHITGATSLLGIGYKYVDFTLRFYHNSTVIKTQIVTIDVTNLVHPVVEFSHYFGSGTIGDSVTVTIECTKGNIQVGPASFFSIQKETTVYGNNTFNGRFRLNEHVPDITLGQLINALRQAFCLDLTFDHQRKIAYLDFNKTNVEAGAQRNYTKNKISGHKITLSNDTIIRSFDFAWPADDACLSENFKRYDSGLLLGTYNTLAALRSAYPEGADFEGKLAKIKNLKQIWRCEQQPDTSFKWVYYTDDYYKETINPDGNTDIAPALAPLMMKYHEIDYATDEGYITPQVSQQGSSAEFDLGENAYGLRLVNYLGQIGDATAGKAIPFSTVTGRDFNGDPTGLMELTWNGDVNDLTELYQWLADALENGEWFEMKLMLNLVDLLLFDVTNPVFMDNQLWLMKGLKVEVGEEIDAATAVMVKVV